VASRLDEGCQMPFMHKLSRRLAQMHGQGRPLLLLALGRSCELPSAAPNLNSIAQVVVLPESVTTDPLQQTAFRAQGVTRTGDSVGVPVTWSATSGTISPS